MFRLQRELGSVLATPQKAKNSETDFHILPLPKTGGVGTFHRGIPVAPYTFPVSRNNMGRSHDGECPELNPWVLHRKPGVPMGPSGHL